jgi:hypothetical protein
MAPTNELRGDACECNCTWTLFGLGFVFPILWLIGACRGSEGPNDRRAARACVIAFLCYLPIWITVVILRLRSGGR